MGALEMRTTGAVSAGHRGVEQVQVVDASVRAHDGVATEVCGVCARPMSAGSVIEFTLRSTRLAQVHARLHPVCAVRFLDDARADLSGFANPA